MPSVYLNVKTDADSYFTKKQQALLSQAQGDASFVQEISENYVPSVLAQIQGPAPVIVAKEHFYSVDRDQLLKVEIASRCAVDELTGFDPLIEGEVVEEDFFSYLAEPFGAIPANTGVLRRTTNMAQVLHIFDLVRIDNGNVVHIAPAEPTVPQPPRPLLRGGVTTTAKLVKGLLKKAGMKVGEAALSKVGAIVLNLVMKELGMDNDHEKMMKEIKKIIKEEIEGNEITKIEGTLDGTLQFLTIEYKNQKDRTDLSKVENRKALIADLKSYSNKFYTEVIGTLKQEKYAIRGIKTFMAAAPIHLLITQEMALIDPDHMDPNQSGFRQTLRENAAVYRTHVRNAYDKAMRDRNNMEVYSKIFTDTMGNSTVSKTTWWWRDNVTGQTAGEFMSSKKPKKSASERAHESLNEHRHAVLEKRKEELGHPEDTFLSSIGDVENFTFPNA